MYGRRGIGTDESVADHAYHEKPSRRRVGPQERTARIDLARVGLVREVRAQIAGCGLVFVRTPGALRHRRHLHVRLA